MDARNKPWVILSLLFLGFSIISYHARGADTISANNSLSGDKTIVSSGGNFVLGFFEPGNSSKSYIGIWYNRVSQRTVVWVANRDRPISDKHSAELKISGGNLVLLNESKTPVWSTNLNSTGSISPVAVLQDTGNFVLRGGSNSSSPIWQSFDHPTHTWLPGGKIGLNKITGRNQLLTSWKNADDPAPGLFSLELDPAGTSQYFIRWNNSKTYWTSGTWNGHIFSLVPEMRLNYIYNFSYVSNNNENYFIYSVYDQSIISRFIMDVSGQIKQLTWLESTGWNLFWTQPRQQCEVYAFCGGYGSCNENELPFCNCLTGFEAKFPKNWSLADYSGGCIRKTQLQCRSNSTANGKKDGFLPSPNMKEPDNGHSVSVGSAAECESTCLNNCSCTAYVYEMGGCSIWIGDLLNLQQLTQGDGKGKTLLIKLASSDLPGHKDNKGKVISIAMGSAAGVVAFLGIVFILFLRRRKRSVRSMQAGEGSLVAFGYKDLQTATRNFSEILGGGGFGFVFKGILPDSTVVAVKKLESFSQGEKQFRTEVSTIGTIQHVNLVRLCGFCSDGIHKLLVYDYMPNGSLDAHLFHEKDGKVLDWKTRYQIALGTARGLAYLHEKCRDCIIHCDIKPENVLLDADFCPKLADFGLAKLLGREFSRVLTTMRGTRGYLAPEWISGVAITPKADVYSYGMMLFEFISGRRNSEHSENVGVKFFPTWAAGQLVEGGDVLSLLDQRLEGSADAEELTKACKLACWCVQDEEAHRPSMGLVVQILEGVLDLNFPPIPRSLQVFADQQEHIVFFSESSRQSSHAQSNASSASSQTKSSMSSMGSKT
ncbi:G-type lectin S-receptor-like serine/threonine-protein kinase At2g19130 [Malania oleifera]|uniref:G-type lectin S-receptor-like serine/threonine-protein kinase At2g19130 n=1 Tax=Malania oleifera TaxID=397392 RepID=UPI0025AEABF6|nr:G-type lectin S-receptor-like serine/threonine-protein kinase At2g19130 [Malania oleifera]